MSPPDPARDAGPSTSTHLHYLRQAVSLARLSPPKPTNFRVGCVIVSFPTTDSSGAHTGTGNEDAPPTGEVLSTGYTLELEGNTHAEQNALTKLARGSENSEQTQERGQGQGKEQEQNAGLGALLTPRRNVHLYTTLEPCGLRLSGATPCVQRIIATRHGNPEGGIRKVIFGAREPGTFVQDSQALRNLDDAGVPWEHVGGLEADILAVAKEGHHNASASERAGAGGGGSRGTTAAANTIAPASTPAPQTRIDDISPEERKRQEQQPRNPKKRMMEVDLSR
ncbi:hypothetical protein A1O7_08028 [Cladophialophora yegresii CBS 114405]|uniref:CMP/dCMP-type deaminase domain-containing protein n=1 Tax=Cladophialophora yegresii CBS 114405 TaxID=1182544 RepID=W9VHY4_9EURO|nr:uncharacterized protein A1O7_08028 [Cladophialophora yegresii CBS 114405]EXJ55103.1 hypothetical protein A1O7_08028 [Cladophialophora yegresii CBS 114405]